MRLGIPAGLIDLGFSHIPEPILEKTRRAIGDLIGRERKNSPSATARKINQGEKTEAEFYHHPFIELGEKYGLASPIDQAILSLVEKHERGEINLGSLSYKRRIELLQREITKLAPDLQIDHNPLGEAVRNLISDILLSLSDFQVRGIENLEALEKGPAIIAFGFHTGHPDSFAVRRAIPTTLRERIIFPAPIDYWYLGKTDPISILRALKNKKDREKLVRTLLNPFFCRAVPFKREGGPKEVDDSLLSLIPLLDQGHTLAFSLEGTRTHLKVHDRHFKTGVALLAIETGKPIIPLILYGTENIMPKGKKLPKIRGNRIVCQIGKPMILDMQEFAKMTPAIIRKSVTARLREELLKMYGDLVQEFGPTSIAPDATIFQRSETVN